MIAPLGWQCPVCARVFAPFVDQCRSCGPEDKAEEPCSFACPDGACRGESGHRGPHWTQTYEDGATERYMRITRPILQGKVQPTTKPSQVAHPISVCDCPTCRPRREPRSDRPDGGTYESQQEYFGIRP